MIQARQVREVFPHMPTSVIKEDLRLTRSVEMTIENIIEGRLAVPPVSTGNHLAQMCFGMSWKIVGLYK